MTRRDTPELVCPAGTPAALRSAIEAGAHSVYCGFNDETNARNFPGLNFSREEMAEAIGFAHRRGAKVLIAINTFPRAGAFGLWTQAVDDAHRFGADAVILADLGLLDYAAEHRKGLRLHLSVQAAAANADAIAVYAQDFGVKRVVLPRVLTVQEIAAINREIEVETEVFVFGGLCVMAEGRCSLSSYATGKSPNMNGACSPASHVEYREEGGQLVSRLGGFRHSQGRGRRARALSDAVQRLVPRRRLSGPRVRGPGQPRCGDADPTARGSRRHGVEDRGSSAQPRLYGCGGRRLPRRHRRLCRRPSDPGERAPRSDRGAEDHGRGLSQGLALKSGMSGRERGLDNRFELTIGPLLFNWSADAFVDFYARIADEAPVERVVVGELVCSKRLPFYADRIPDVIERLERGGKTVALTTLALPTLERERRAARQLAEQTEHELEIEDLTLLRWMEPEDPFAVGPLVNVYNERTLAYLARRGARRFCLPPELPVASVGALAGAAVEVGSRVEVWAYGRIPLAISSRCYHARVHGLSKDSCQFVCANDPDGWATKTLDGADFLAVNGVQTLSHVTANLIGDLDRLAEAGVHALRLSPHTGDFVAVTQTFADAVAGRISAQEGLARLREIAPEAQFSNGFLFGDRGASTLARAAL